jgi:hypothetical protein
MLLRQEFMQKTLTMASFLEVVSLRSLENLKELRGRSALIQVSDKEIKSPHFMTL